MLQEKDNSGEGMWGSRASEALTEVNAYFQQTHLTGLEPRPSQHEQELAAAHNSMSEAEVTRHGRSQTSRPSSQDIVTGEKNK